tara:strand:- start:1093 stop:2004 length:912 start_codon:yes stop_codon:yes gene_type:complete
MSNSPHFSRYRGRLLSKKQIEFYNKRVSPYGYYPWRQLAKEIFAEHFDDSRKDHLLLSKTPSVIANKAFLNAPVFFLTDELCKAFIKTKFTRIKIEEKPKVIAPYFILMQSTNINNINYSFIDQSEKKVDVSMSFSYQCNKTKNRGTYLNTFFNWNEFQNSLNDSDELLTNFKIDKSNKEQTRLMNTIFNQKSILVNFILLLNTQPDILTEEYIPNSTLQGKKSFKPSNQELKSLITWVGKDFTQRIIKTKPKTDEILEKNTGKPKRSHWRRGHWHTILQGPKRKQRKMKWFQPAFIVGNCKK